MTALAYQLVMAGLRLISPFRKEKPVPNYYPGWGEGVDPEPKWAHCMNCGQSTVWEAYRWVMESTSEIDYECSVCGAVS